MDCYSHYDKNANRYEPLQTQKIAKTLQRICPSAKGVRVKITSGKQERGYTLPAIEIARDEFESTIKTKINWDNHTPETQEPEYDDEYDFDLLYDTMKENASGAI